MGNYIVLFVIGSFLNLFFTQVNGTCGMENRIKTRDPDLTVVATESPCQMVVSSNDRRQVVIVIYNYGRNCIGSGVMTISDGNLQNSTVINNACRARNVSFISRNHGIIITITAPFQPFDIDLHLIETEIQYNQAQGTIVSPRYPSSDGGYTSATPNNFQGKYTIVSTYNVSMYIEFTEIRIQPSPAEATSACSTDVLKVLKDLTLTAAYCGNNIQTEPVNVIASELTLEYITDDFTTYAGFAVQYNVCIEEVDDAHSEGRIDFQGFPTVRRRCMFIIRLTQQRKIQLALEMDPKRNCSHSVMIFPDDKSSIQAQCNEVQEVTGTVIRIVFDLEDNESLKGNYSISYSSTEEGTSGKDGSSPFSDEKSASATGVIVGIVVTVIFFIIVIVIGIIVYKRKKNKKNRKPSLSMDEVAENVYEYKEDYDHLNVKRDHINTSNDQNSNVYGRMISSEVQDEYAVVNKDDKEPAEISANEYGAETFSTEYEETTKPTTEQKVIDDNVYE